MIITKDYLVKYVGVIQLTSILGSYCRQCNLNQKPTVLILGTQKEGTICMERVTNS